MKNDLALKNWLWTDRVRSRDQSSPPPPTTPLNSNELILIEAHRTSFCCFAAAAAAAEKNNATARRRSFKFLMVILIQLAAAPATAATFKRQAWMTNKSNFVSSHQSEWRKFKCLNFSLHMHRQRPISKYSGGGTNSPQAERKSTFTKFFLNIFNCLCRLCFSGESKQRILRKGK